SVIGACPPEEAEEIVSFALKMGFSSRVLLVHDSHGQINLNSQEIKVFEKIVDMLPRRWPELSSYRKRLIRDGSAPFKCRAGSRYLYVDEYGRVNWCSQTRAVWSKALMDYTPNDLREQFYSYKSCHATCTLNCSRSDLRRWPELSSYRKRLIRDGSAPFKCRAGSRYLYVDEYGRVNWCSQTRAVWSKALMDYTPNDLREQFYSYKSCHATCTLNCSRSNRY